MTCDGKRCTSTPTVANFQSIEPPICTCYQRTCHQVILGGNKVSIQVHKNDIMTPLINFHSASVKYKCNSRSWASFGRLTFGVGPATQRITWVIMQLQQLAKLLHASIFWAKCRNFWPKYQALTNEITWHLKNYVQQRN